MEMTRGSRQACKVRLVCCVCVCVCVLRLFLSRGEWRVGRIVSFHEMPPEETGATRPSSFCCVLFGWILMRCMHACSKKDRGGRRCRARAMKHCVRVTDSRHGASGLGQQHVSALLWVPTRFRRVTTGVTVGHRGWKCHFQEVRPGD